MSPAKKIVAKKHRGRQRGAAMVEAAVILPVMIVFFGVMAMAHSAGKSKLAAQHEARASVMYFASSSCKNRMTTDDSSRAESTGDSLPNTESGDTNEALGDAAAGGSMEARASWSLAQGGAARSATTYGRTRTAKSESWALCNESPNDGNMVGLASYAFELFGSTLPAPIRGAK